MNDEAPALIEIRNLSFKFSGTGDPVLRDVDLRIDDGEFVVLTGPSGCGKSTLCQCMCGFLPKQGDEMIGSILLNGRTVAERTVYELARDIGMVQQDPEAQICTLNATDEVAFGPENYLMPAQEILDRVRWALETVGGETIATRETTKLSGGEKQRIAIASVLALKPNTIIFDEPTSQLDPKGSNQILSIVSELRRRTNLTIIVVEHKLRQVLPLSSRIVIMDKGRIVMDLRPDEIGKHTSAIGSMGVRLPSASLGHRIRPAGLRAGKRVLDVDSLSVSFPDGKKALSNVSFGVAQREIVGLMGDNGSGKSTLLMTLLGLQKPTSGSIILEGEDALRMQIRERARRIGFIFQNPNHQIFESTVWKELLFACENFGMDMGESERRGKELLEAGGLTAYSGRHPYGMSYGEKRRLNLSSVFIYEPRLLLMDEPFVGQDFRNIQQLMRFTTEFAEMGSAAIMVLHEPEIAALYCDRILFLREGHVLLDAPTDEAFKSLKEMNEIDYIPEAATSADGP